MAKLINDNVTENSGIVINSIYYSKADMEALTDGDVCDLVQHVCDTYAGPDGAKLDLIYEILKLSEEAN